jgi:hypothetical protein
MAVKCEVEVNFCDECKKRCSFHLEGSGPLAFYKYFPKQSTR